MTTETKRTRRTPEELVAYHEQQAAKAKERLERKAAARAKAQADRELERKRKMLAGLSDFDISNIEAALGIAHEQWSGDGVPLYQELLDALRGEAS